MLVIPFFLILCTYASWYVNVSISYTLHYLALHTQFTFRAPLFLNFAPKFAYRLNNFAPT